MHLIHRGWNDDPALLDAVRASFTYPAGEDRVGGYLYTRGEQEWPTPLADLGPALLKDLRALLDVEFTIALFQAYLDGSGCDWHADDAFDTQAILSLGVTRTFGIRRLAGAPSFMSVSHGDLVYMPAGFQREWQHCVPAEPVAGERCSLVFRTPRS